MSELKPCPFCGGEGFVRIDISLHPTQSRYRVGCDKDSSCHGWYGHSRYYTTEAEAIAAWNSRAAMEFDNWFYLPKPKEPIVEVTETTHAWDGTKIKTDVFYQVQEQAVINWAKELDEHIIKRICEVWNSRADYHGYEQAAIEAWESIKAWNSRSERTCHIEERYGNQYCTCCGEMVGTWDSTSELYIDGNMVELWNYCPNCGARRVGE